MLTINELQKRNDQMNDENKHRLAGYADGLLEMERAIERAFNISKGELDEILSEKKMVEGLLYKEDCERKKFSPQLKRLSILAMTILLICCFAIPGFADNARGRIVAIFTGITANRIVTIPYDKTDQLYGCIVPNMLPDGFQYRSIQRSESRGLYSIIYTNSLGNVIVYYHYASGMTGSFDNEHTDLYALGNINVGRNGEQTTISFPYMDAHIQMEFDIPVSDAEIRLIAGSLIKI